MFEKINGETKEERERQRQRKMNDGGDEKAGEMRKIRMYDRGDWMIRRRRKRMKMMRS